VESEDGSLPAFFWRHFCSASVGHHPIFDHRHGLRYIAAMSGLLAVTTIATANPIPLLSQKSC
jgi:hypothetical protein